MYLNVDNIYIHSIIVKYKVLYVCLLVIFALIDCLGNNVVFLKCKKGIPANF